jgi:hypothetical protein
MLDEFSFLVCSSNYSLLVLLLKNERTIDRFIKAFPSLDGIDECESNTSNKHDMLFLCVPVTYIYTHTRRIAVYVSVHIGAGKSVKEKDVSKRGKKKRIRLKGNISTSFA